MPLPSPLVAASRALVVEAKLAFMRSTLNFVSHSFVGLSRERGNVGH